MTAQPDSGALRGVLERIIFSSEENAYVVAEFRPENAAHTLTIAGSLPNVHCGETLSIQGDWRTHKTHGRQFHVVSFSSELPATVYGIRKFLSSGLVRGIGKRYADKIVDAFGADTLRIISEESARLRDVEGIGPKRAKAIKAAWDEQRSLRDVLIFLQQYGVTTGLCVKLVKEYGQEAGAILRSDPYRVAREIPGIGFKTADKIALNLGLPTDGSARVDAGILFTLRELEDDGHTACPHDELLTQATTLLGTSVDRVRERIGALTISRDLVALQGILQFPHNHRFEQRISLSVRLLTRSASSLPPIKVDAAVQWAEERAGFTFGEEQRHALRQALSSKLSILTGGPGTGKTTILRALVAILQAKKARVHLAAPTGRAAQRLAETTRGFAQTIHRMLKFDPKSGGFTVNQEHPLNTDFLVVDEASMLDTRLAAALLQAVPAGAHVLLVGDADQLPSVGAGNVLKDLIECGRLPVTRLDRIFRQREGSFIVRAAHAVNKGEVLLPRAVQSLSEVEWDGDFTFISAPDAERCLETVLRLVGTEIPVRINYDPLTEVQVLAPMHKGVAGVGNLNQRLQNALNNKMEFVRGAGVSFSQGDKVLQLRNNYDKGIFNGDTGFVTQVDPQEGTLRARFDKEELEFDRSELGDLTLAYAMSIHKSQGSEYPVVVIPLLKAHFMMLTRNLLYTAMTRGKRRVFIVGDPAAYAMAVRNAEVQVRWTHLIESIGRPADDA